MAWAKQSTVGDTAQAQIGLFMRTGPFARKNPVAIAEQQQIDLLQPEAEDGLTRQPVQRTDRNPFIVLWRHDEWRSREGRIAGRPRATQFDSGTYLRRFEGFCVKRPGSAPVEEGVDIAVQTALVHC